MRKSTGRSGGTSRLAVDAHSLTDSLRGFKVRCRRVVRRGAWLVAWFRNPSGSVDVFEETIEPGLRFLVLR
jgi:hypothetical protein